MRRSTGRELSMILIILAGDYDYDRERAIQAPQTLNPKLQTLNLEKPKTLRSGKSNSGSASPKPETPNPKP
jgi:hypothetical protein